MDRTWMLRQAVAKEAEGMPHEIAALLKSQAKYLDAQQTAEPTSGLELYQRYDNLRELVRREFPDLDKRIPARRYWASDDGSLLRSDLGALRHDLEAILRLLAEPS